MQSVTQGAVKEFVSVFRDQGPGTLRSKMANYRNSMYEKKSTGSLGMKPGKEKRSWEEYRTKGSVYAGV